MKIEETIEKAVQGIMQARTYFTTNSVPVVRFRDRLTAKGDHYCTVHAMPFKRLAPKRNLYRLTLELLADSKSQADPKSVQVDAIHAQNSDEINNIMSTTTLQAAIDAVDAVSGITIDGFVQDQGSDADGEYQIIRSAVVISLTYVKQVPTNTVAPVASGTGEEGEVLSCTTGTWTGDPTSYSYQWESDGTPIAGATASTFTVTASEEATDVTCAVKATNSAGISAASDSNSITISTP